MATRRGGIVTVSSIAARLGNANMWVHYAASKAALDTVTFGRAREAGPDGIRVNAVAPGLIDTEMHEAAGGSERYPPIVQDTPLGRVGTPEAVAERSCGCCRMPRASSPAPWSK